MTSSVIVGSFDQAGQALPSGWKEQTFDPETIPKTSEYETVELKGESVLKGSTDGGASMIYRPVKVDWKDYPIIAWRWRVDQVFEKEDERAKSGDDYPARLYVAFQYDPDRVGWLTRRLFNRAKRQSKQDKYPPLYTLTYVWATNEPVGAVYPNPYQERVQMIVVKSGKAGLKQWHGEAVNYLEDFKEIFGEDPTELEYIAIMIDGDNTDSKGVAYFDDIRFLQKMPEKKTSPGDETEDASE